MPSTWLEAGASTFDLTGIQLEVSDHSTDFEFLPFSEVFRKCQRYYEEGMVSSQSYVNGQQNIGVPAKYTTIKRAAASVTFTDDATPSSGNVASVSSVQVHRNRVDGAFSYTDSSGAGNYYFYYIYKASAEL